MVISIVTPTLNARRYLPECIASVKAQRSAGGVIEHIVVDGGSTDGTADYAEAHNVRVLRGKDKGIFDAINRGSRASSGEWLGFLGADDVLLDRALDAIVASAGHTSSPWATGSVRYIDEANKPIGNLRPLPEWVPTSMMACLGWSPTHHIATYLRREFFEELGGFNIEYTVAADYDLFLRATARAACQRIDGTLAAMRRTGTNFSARNAALGRQQCLAIRQRYGPRFRCQQRVYREIVRVWVNAANPTWSMRKVFGRPY